MSAMTWIRIASVLGFLGVALGAFGAHGLKGRIEDAMLANYQTGVLYHLVHAVAVFAVALYGRARGVEVSVPASLFTAGIVLFSGSLYVMAFTGVKKLGMITPIGGLAMLGGWVAAAIVLGRQ